MSFDVVNYSFLEGLAHFAKIFLVLLAVLSIGGLLVSLSRDGVAGAKRFGAAWGAAFYDLFHTSFRRIWAIALLTWKEATRKKALFVFVVFAILIMFAGWFLRNSVDRADLQVKNYVSFVLTSISWLTLPVILLLCCWGLPTDIKNRSLHTVVTKPVRKQEVVLGRFLGYTLVGTVVLAVMGTIGYFWTVGNVPESAQSELIGRVPIYGDMSFSNRQGNRSSITLDDNDADERTAGINVGDIWEYRSYIEGGTKSRTFYDFKNIDVDQLRQAGQMRLEYNFEAFRSHKGDMDKRLLCRLTIVNQQGENEDEKLRVPLPIFEVKEFSNRATDKTITLEETVTYNEEGTNEVKTVNLFDDVLAGGDITIEVQCLDPGQFLGMARPDLYIRLPDSSFASTYFRGVFGIWLQMVLIVVLGVTASTFVKGPVATLLTFGMLAVGAGLRDLMSGLVQGTQEGGGPFESAYRMFMHMNPTVEVDAGPLTPIMHVVDSAAIGFLWTVQHLFPEFKYFNMTSYVANGFLVPWRASLLPSIAVTLAFVIPCLILGYVAMKSREMEAK